MPIQNPTPSMGLGVEVPKTGSVRVSNPTIEDLPFMYAAKPYVLPAKKITTLPAPVAQHVVSYLKIKGVDYADKPDPEMKGYKTEKDYNKYMDKWAQMVLEDAVQKRLDAYQAGLPYTEGEDVVKAIAWVNSGKDGRSS